MAHTSADVNHLVPPVTELVQFATLNGSGDSGNHLSPDKNSQFSLHSDPPEVFTHCILANDPTTDTFGTPLHIPVPANPKQCYLLEMSIQMHKGNGLQYLPIPETQPLKVCGSHPNSP
jgi:hypothetical protein